MTNAPPTLDNGAGVAHRETWHNRSAQELLAQLESSSTGLSGDEAHTRLAADGPNELKRTKRIGAMQILTGQFKSPIIWILMGAGILSGILGGAVDALVIFAIVILNAVVGFYQEYKAEQSLEALQKLSSPQAKVLRNGQIQLIPASSIVAGDILELEAGDVVAADARLLEAASLRCIEAALTGESEPAAKDPAALEGVDVPLGDRDNMVFAGTSVAAGTGLGVVVATGMNTELGRIAVLMQEAGADKGTPLQRKLDSVGHVLLWAALAVVALVFVLGLLRGVDLFELFMTAISLAVTAVPEGLPAVVTVALSLGVSRMARRHALVRKLPAVETLGSTNVICTDKTGTLTMGEMTARALYVDARQYDVTGEGYGPEGEVRFEGQKAVGVHTAPLLQLSNVLLGCNNAQLVDEKGAWRAIGDPTEAALLLAGAKAGGDRAQLERDLPSLKEFPFDSDRKRGSVIRRKPDGSWRAFVNGAPGPLLQQCTHLYTTSGLRPLAESDRERILSQTTAMASHALRILGSAYRDLDASSDSENSVAADIERDLVFVGLTGLYDPPRAEAKTAIQQCVTAGIRVVMITGDHPKTASAIAQELGIESGVVVTGAELDRFSEAELKQRAPGTAVYARVTAEHKLRIVRAWQANDAVVAMTGDGVNDAPAIKGADVGIAMGKAGTEVTRQAADMVLTDDNFATIVAAVEEGRGVYDNIRKALQYLLAGNTAELILMTVCVAAGLPSPLLPIHLLWINLVTDGLPALCLANDPVDPQVMARHPRARSESITSRGFLPTMFLTGGLTAGVAFAVYLYVLQTETTATARTYAFAALVFSELLRAFGARSEMTPIWRIPLWANRYLVLVVVISITLQLWSQHSITFGSFLKTTPVSFAHFWLLLALGAIPLLILEMVKLGRNAPRNRKLSKS